MEKNFVFTTLIFQVKRRAEAKAEGKVWYDEEEAKFQRERIPVTLRLEPGGEIRDLQLSVYEHFAKNIPGFMTDAEVVHQHRVEEQTRLRAMQYQRLQQQQQQTMQSAGPKGVSQDVKEEDFIMVSS